jgi:hypothetical protein
LGSARKRGEVVIMQSWTREPAITADVVVRLEHQQVATKASAEILRRTRHPAAAARLLVAAADLAAEIETVVAGGLPRHRVCLVCGCTDAHACPDGCHWVCADTGVDLCSRCLPLLDPSHVPAERLDRLLSVVNPDDDAHL